MKKVYFASPLFSDMERMYNAHVVSVIREHFDTIDVFVPQEQDSINDKNAYADARMIAKYDTEAVLASDLMIAVIDGLSIDPGVASEIGIAYQAGIPVIGLYTDTRQQGATNSQKIEALNTIGESQFSYVNLYTVGLIKLNGALVSSHEEVIEKIHCILEI